MRLWDVTTGTEVARFVAFQNDEWVCMTSEGYYTCSSGGDARVNVRVGARVEPVDAYRKTYMRSDLVRAALASWRSPGFSQEAKELVRGRGAEPRDVPRGSQAVVRVQR